jgi:hypothetical protein
MPHAQVFAGLPGARLQSAKLLGLTSADGVLRVDQVSSSADVSYLAMSGGSCAAFRQHPDGIYRATLASHEVITVTTVGADGTPVPDCKVFLSRVPLADAAWTAAPSGTTWVPSLEDPHSAIYAATTDHEGRAILRGLRQGGYFWRVTHETRIPWGNDLRATLPAGGSYRIVMRQVSAAVLVVRGDTVVSSDFIIPAAVHQESLPGAIELQRRLQLEHDASLACVMPDEALDAREILVRCYLRHYGPTEIRVPFRPLGPGFSPFVHTMEGSDDGPVCTATISIDFRSPDGTSIPPPPWSLQSSLRNWRRSCRDGGDLVEVPPGQYVVVFDHDVLRRCTRKASVTVGPGDACRVSIDAPDGLARCSVRLLNDRRQYDNWDGCTVLAVRDGQVVESVTGTACRELWLPPGQYVVQAWVPGFLIRDTLLVVSRQDADLGSSSPVADLWMQKL